MIPGMQANTSGVNKELESNIAVLEKLSQQANVTSKTINRLNKQLVGLRKIHIDIELKGINSLDKLSKFDDEKLQKLNENLTKIKDTFNELNKDKSFENFNFEVKGLDDLNKVIKGLDHLNNLDTSKFQNSMQSLVDIGKTLKNTPLDFDIQIDEKQLEKMKTVSDFLKYTNTDIEKLKNKGYRTHYEEKRYSLVDNINKAYTDREKKEAKELEASKNKKNKERKDTLNAFANSTKAGKTISNTATKLNDFKNGLKETVQIIKTLGPVWKAAGATVAVFLPILVASIANLKKAQKNSLDLARANAAMNRSFDYSNGSFNSLSKASVAKSAIGLQNNVNNMKHIWDRFTTTLGSMFIPALEIATNGLTKLTGEVDQLDSVIATVQSNAVSSMHQSGMTKAFSYHLEAGLKDIAKQLSKGREEEASDILAALSDAFINGSDAAGQYGVVLNDNVLTGYMAEQGVDIANVEITDAMKQYYRYQLLIAETSKDVTDQQIRHWQELGFMIDKTKGKLFSFDEVIQLAAVDPTIPDFFTEKDIDIYTDVHNAEDLYQLLDSILQLPEEELINLGFNKHSIEMMQRVHDMLETMPAEVRTNINVETSEAMKKLLDMLNLANKVHSEMAWLASQGGRVTKTYSIRTFAFDPSTTGATPIASRGSNRTDQSISYNSLTGKGGNAGISSYKLNSDSYNTLPGYNKSSSGGKFGGQLRDIHNKTDAFYNSGFASGGIGTKELHNATLFEGNKKEAIIPLETHQGIQYLADAMRAASGDTEEFGGSNTVVNLTLTGIFDTNDQASWERVGRKVAEVIDVQRQRRGDLNYGSTI